RSVRFELRDEFRLAGGEVILRSGIVLQVVKLQGASQSLLHGLPARSERSRGISQADRLIESSLMEFPIEELVTPLLLPEDRGKHGEAVQSLGNFRSRDFGGGRKEVAEAPDLIA